MVNHGRWSNHGQWSIMVWSNHGPWSIMVHGRIMVNGQIMHRQRPPRRHPVGAHLSQIMIKQLSNNGQNGAVSVKVVNKRSNYGQVKNISRSNHQIMVKCCRIMVKCWSNAGQNGARTAADSGSEAGAVRGRALGPGLPHRRPWPSAHSLGRGPGRAHGPGRSCSGMGKAHSGL